MRASHSGAAPTTYPRPPSASRSMAHRASAATFSAEIPVVHLPRHDVRYRGILEAPGGALRLERNGRAVRRLRDLAYLRGKEPARVARVGPFAVPSADEHSSSGPHRRAHR